MNETLLLPRYRDYKKKSSRRRITLTRVLPMPRSFDVLLIDRPSTLTLMFGSKNNRDKPGEGNGQKTMRARNIFSL